MHSDHANSRPKGGRKFNSGNLILVGLMGSGKTTMGRALAKHLGKTFVDSDDEVQQRTGVTIPHIFDIEGESGFRQRETAAIRELVERDDMVLATGGGAVLAEENRVLLQQNGIIVYLKANVHDLWLRTRHDRSRPLLQTGDPRAKLTELFQQRDPLYQQVADITVQSGKQTVHGLMLYLVNEIEAFKANDASQGRVISGHGIEHEQSKI
ncbi:MAG TPA: shikimate kinase [Gallionella sp.]|nr:shikimate kinase [Gallionella sp.]